MLLASRNVGRPEERVFESVLAGERIHNVVVVQVLPHDRLGQCGAIDAHCLVRQKARGVRRSEVVYQAPRDAKQLETIEQLRQLTRFTLTTVLKHASNLLNVSMICRPAGLIRSKSVVRTIVEERQVRDITGVQPSQ